MQSGGPQQSYMTKTMARFKKEPLIPIGERPPDKAHVSCPET